jgi:hypothetical protein
MLYFRALAPALLLSLSLAACASSSEDAAADRSTSEASVDAAVASRVDVVRRRIAANNAKDWDAWESLHTVDAVRTAPELPEPLRGAKAMRAGIEELLQTFPDYHLELVDAFGSGDRLVALPTTRCGSCSPQGPRTRSSASTSPSA